MHLRISRVRSNRKLYEYVQIVDSYRRPSDGMPAHRVIANLGRLAPTDIENLRLTLEAARQGRRVVLAAPEQPVSASRSTPLANLRYLDVATLWELWCQLGLDELVRQAIPSGEADVPLHRVVAALAIQRCADPGSKLFATRWVPRTALPELLGFVPSSFNNTRVHRVLEELDGAGSALMARLAKSYEDRDGAFSALFLDVTDTWFVGRGPSMAEKAKTKEGRMESKIGIVLMCNQQGYPVRWEVVSGRTADSLSMTAMLRSVAALPWAQETPVVVDRAMGTTSVIRRMNETKLLFLTALVQTEFPTYAPSIPYQPFETMALNAAEDFQEQAERAARCAQDAGLQRVDETLFLLDLGRVEVPLDDEALTIQAAPNATALRAMQLCRQIRDLHASGTFTTLAQAGRSLGLRSGLTKKYLQLSKLHEDIQAELLRGRADNCSLKSLLRLTSIEDPMEQRREFERLLVSPGQNRPPGTQPQPEAPTTPPVSMTVRVVTYFNPEQFVEQRLHAQQVLRELEEFVQGLNLKLAQPGSRLKPENLQRQLGERLRRLQMIELFHIQLVQSQTADHEHVQIRLELDEANWIRRRRYDGFSLLVAHPLLTHTAEALCRLYRAKDAVEKDFQIIKSVVELRPVRHRNDAKVRAHVSLCMLALLLERSLNHRLRGTCSAAMALELMKSCCLNQYGRAEGKRTYVVTIPNEEQQRLLRRLRLTRLADDAAIAERIQPR